MHIGEKGDWGTLFIEEKRDWRKLHIEDKGDWRTLHVEERETGEFCILKIRRD
jgi:hypothetical protein